MLSPILLRIGSIALETLGVCDRDTQAIATSLIEVLGIERVLVAILNKLFNGWSILWRQNILI